MYLRAFGLEPRELSTSPGSAPARGRLGPGCDARLGGGERGRAGPRGPPGAPGLLYLAIVALWALTVLYVIKTKWVLAILFLFPFFKHIFVNDLPVLLGAVPPVPASVWLKECSMLCFMLALFFYALSMEPGPAPCDEQLRSESEEAP